MSSTTRGQSLNARGNSNTIGNIFTTGGNIGINTTSPSNLLHIVNNNASYAGIKLEGNTTDIYTSLKNTGTNGREYLIGSGSGASAAGVGNFYIHDATSSKFRIVIGTSGNVGISTTSPVSTLNVNPIVIDSALYDHSVSPITITQNASSGTTVLNDQLPVMHLCRQGRDAQTYGQRATFALSRYENNSVNSRTRLDIQLSQNSYDTINVMSIRGDGNVGIGTTSPAYTLDVNGTIARSGVKLPRFDNGTFSTASTAVIPILFNDTQYNYVEIKVRYQVSTRCDVTLYGSTSSNGSSPFAVQEMGETTVKYSTQGSPVYTTSGLISQSTEAINVDNNFTIRITRATGGSNARNHYSFETVYCWWGIGTAKVYGMGHIDTASNLSNALLSIVMSASSGTISGIYSTQHSY